MTIEDREYLFDHAQQLSEILNEECVELLGMLEKIEDRVAISKRINKLEDDGDHIFHAFADRLHQRTSMKQRTTFLVLTSPRYSLSFAQHLFS